MEDTNTNYTRYKLYKTRWLVLAAYCFHCLCVAPAATGFTSVSNILQYYFDVEPIAIHMLMGVFGVSTMLFTLPAAYLLHKFELAFALKVSGSLNVVGAIIRFFSYDEKFGYPLLIVGNIFTAISLTTFEFLAPKLAQNWFATNERGTAIGIGVGFDLLATSIGFILGTQIVRNSKNKEKIKSDLRTLNIILLVAACLSFVALMFVKSKPKTPPSSYDQDILEIQTAAQNSVNDKEETQQSPSLLGEEGNVEIMEHKSDFFKTVKKLLRHRNFLRIVHITALLGAIEIAFSMILNDMLIHKFPGTEKKIGIVGFLSIILGFVSNIFTGIIIDKTRAFKTVSFVIFCLTLVCMLVWTVLLEVYHSFVAVSIIFCLMMMIGTSYYSVSATYLIEATYPIDSGKSTMLSTIMESFYVFAIAGSSSFVLVYIRVLYVNIIGIIIVLIAMVLNKFITPIDNRPVNRMLSKDALNEEVL